MARRFEQHYLVAFAFLKRNRSSLSKLTDSLPPDGGIDLHQVGPSGSFLTRIKDEHELVRMIWHKLAFVALDKQSGELAGIGRLSSDPDHEIAEYAVLVRTDLQGRGLGWQLLRQLIDFARADGVRQIEGLILSENKKMLTLCREFGFTVVHHPSDQSLLLATLNLQPA